MAKADVNAVFDMLNKVFAGEMEYDEALMNLDYHTAQVRKQWPALYSALAGKTSVGELSDLAKAQLKGPLEGVQVIRGDNGVKVEPTPEEDLISYREWAQGPCHNMHVDEEALVDWDATNSQGEPAPMPGLNGEPFTLRGANARSRFQVLEGNPETGRMRLKKVASLPMSG